MSNFDQAAAGAITGDGALAAAIDVQGVANQLGLTLSGTFVVNVQVQISFDGAEFVDFGSPQTAPGYLAIPACHTVDLVADTYVSGTAEWRLGGLRSVDD